MAPVGRFAIRVGWLAIYFGFYVAFYVSFPTLFGEPPNINYTTMLLSALYLIFLPICLIPPVWAAHKAMQLAKEVELEEVAVQMRELLLDIRTASDAAKVGQVESLQTTYNLLNNEYHTWPFQFRALRRFSAFALLPVLTMIGNVVFSVFLTKAIE
jgi:hypothetical protein